MRRLGEDFAEIILVELETNGVTFMANANLEGFESAPSGQIIVKTNSGALEADLVLMGIGVTPEVSLASEAGLNLGPTGAIAVNEHLQTSIPFVYAAGDCCECFHRVSLPRKPGPRYIASSSEMLIATAFWRGAVFCVELAGRLLVNDWPRAVATRH